MLVKIYLSVLGFQASKTCTVIKSKVMWVNIFTLSQTSVEYKTKCKLMSCLKLAILIYSVSEITSNTKIL